MYIGPQGIVHGTTITVLNAGRKISKHGEGLAGKLFVTAGLGGMSGAQHKAGNIAGWCKYHCRNQSESYPYPLFTGMG